MNRLKVFDITYEEFRVTAHYQEEKNPSAKIKIYKDSKVWKEFEYPAYKIFNIGAHFKDMVDNYHRKIESESPNEAGG